MVYCVDPNSDNANFLYCPSPVPSILFSVLFGLTTIAHVAQAFAFRKRFCWVIIMAATWETLGFILRTLAVYNATSEGYAIASQLLILLSPLWINAFDYMVLGRMVYFFLPDQRILGIRATRLTLIFVLLDVGSFLVQGVGGSMISGSNVSYSQEMLGIHVYMGGIGIQQLFILIFFGLAIQFQRKVLRTGSAEAGATWRPLLYTLYASLTLITIRIIYRLIEFSGGIRSSLPTHEAPLYVLEALPMFIACVIMNIWHPGRYLVGPESEFPRLSRAEQKAIKKAKKQDKKDKKAAKMEAKVAKKAVRSGWWDRPKDNVQVDQEIGLPSYSTSR